MNCDKTRFEYIKDKMGGKKK